MDSRHSIQERSCRARQRWPMEKPIEEKIAAKVLLWWCLFSSPILFFFFSVFSSEDIVLLGVEGVPFKRRKVNQ